LPTGSAGERPLMVSGLALQAVGMAWLALIAEVGMAYSQVLAPFVVADVGVSMAIPAGQNSAAFRDRQGRPAWSPGVRF
jgi:hypothetical protein